MLKPTDGYKHLLVIIFNARRNQVAAATGSKSGIGTSAVQVTTTSNVMDYGISIKAASTNTGKVYVGIANTVTANTVDVTDGYELNIGEEVFIPKAMVSNANGVWVIASAPGQEVYFMCV